MPGMPAEIVFPGSSNGCVPIVPFEFWPRTHFAGSSDSRPPGSVTLKALASPAVLLDRARYWTPPEVTTDAYTGESESELIVFAAPVMSEPAEIVIGWPATVIVSSLAG